MTDLPESRTSLSLLMHATLAALSPEMQMVDSMLLPPLGASNTSVTIQNILAPELILIVRDYLLPSIIDDLLAQSHTALKEYEAFKRRSWCADCLAYNDDVFGSDVWEWERCTAPCTCRKHTSVECTTPKYLQAASSKYFSDRVSWLEAYLSFKVSTLRCPSSTITEAMLLVLQRHDCRILSTPSAPRLVGPSPTFAAPAYPTPVIIAPAEYQLPCNRADDSDAPSKVSRDPSIVISRALRDLGLDQRYDNDLQLEHGVDDKQHSRLRMTPSKTSTAEVTGNLTGPWLDVITMLFCICLSFTASNYFLRGQ